MRSETHPDGQERNELLRRVVEQADLDEVQAEEVLHVALDVVLEEIDPVLGDLWVGDVGQDLHEEIDKVTLSNRYPTEASTTA